MSYLLWNAGREYNLHNKILHKAKVNCLQVHTRISSFLGLPTVQFLIAYHTEGRLGPFYHVNDISVYQVDEEGRGPRSKMIIIRARVLRHEQARSVRYSLCERSKLQRLGRKVKDLKLVLLIGDSW